MTDGNAIGLWRLLRPLFFQLDPETAHQIALTLAAAWGKTLESLGAARSSAQRQTSGGAGTRKVMQIEFPNPIGLAAGLDKDATALGAWQRLGFGFVEVGTVTAHAQPGNPRPRLFRFPREQALVNRMGFNNRGAADMAQRLAALRAKGRISVPLGVNIGKSKQTASNEAAADYLESFAKLGALADYVVVNISSPNTPGLRALQSVEEIKRIIGALQGLNQRLEWPRPLLIKLAPDLDDKDATDCARAALGEGCAGLILTNTTMAFDPIPNPPADLSGGLSGRPLLARSTALLAGLRAALGPQPVLIGVGGIMSPQDAAEKFAAGADLVQIYTGLIYRGPGLIRRLVETTCAPTSADGSFSSARQG